MNINNILFNCLNFKYIIISDLKKIKNNFLNKLKLLSNQVFIKVYKVNLFKKLYNLNNGNLFFFFNNIDKFHNIYGKYFKKISIKKIISFKKKIQKNTKNLFKYKKNSEIFFEIIKLLENFFNNFFYFFINYYECRKNI
ncbi:hypothetical protein [Candidatus Vidania fulgoroideorum]